MSKGFGMNAAELSLHGLPVPAGGDAPGGRDPPAQFHKRTSRHFTPGLSATRQ